VPSVRFKIPDAYRPIGHFLPVVPYPQGSSGVRLLDPGRLPIVLKGQSHEAAGRHSRVKNLCFRLDASDCEVENEPRVWGYPGGPHVGTWSKVLARGDSLPMRIECSHAWAWLSSPARAVHFPRKRFYARRSLPSRFERVDLASAT